MSKTLSPNPSKSATSRPGLSALNGGILAGIAALGASFWCAAPANAHDAPSGWRYPFACCANYDCQEVSSKAISEKPEGYVVQTTGEIVGYQDKRVRDSPDGEFHWCAHQSGLDAGKTICLFVPPRSF